MTNPYGPSGPSNHSNPGRGSGQSRPVGASMQGGGPVSGGERLEQSQTTARRPRSSRLIVGSIIGMLVVALLGIGSFVVFHEGGIGLGGSNSPTPTARATGNGEQYPATVDEAGEVLVSGRLLADISKSLPSKPVSVELDGQKVNLVCGSSHFTLAVMPLDEYPLLPAQPTGIGAIDSSTLSQADRTRDRQWRTVFDAVPRRGVHRQHDENRTGARR